MSGVEQPPEELAKEAGGVEEADARMDAFEAALIEQEHRTVRVALNAYQYFGDNGKKKKAAMRALFWRVFAPYTAMALFAGGGTFVAAASLFFLSEQNDKLDAQTVLMDRQTNALDAQNLLLQRELEIAANEGNWERLWNVHYGSSSIIRVDAATELARSGVVLSNVDLRGDFSGLPARIIHGYSLFEDLLPITTLDVSDLPSELSNTLRDSRVNGFGLFLEDGDGRHNTFTACRVALNSTGDYRGITAYNSEIIAGDLSGHQPVLHFPSFHESVLVAVSNLQVVGGRLDNVAISTFEGIEASLGLNPANEEDEPRYGIFLKNIRATSIAVATPETIGFRNSRIDTLVVAIPPESAHQLDAILSQLLAPDCVVENVLVVSIDFAEREPHGVVNHLTAEASDWIDSHLDQQ